MKISETLQRKIKNIKVLAMDVDGVLTDGQLIFDGQGRELKSFHVQDGFGMVILKRAGIKTAIITAGASRVVKIRADYLHVDKLYSGVYPKMNAYKKMLKAFGVQPAQVCFMGDDLTDWQILSEVGFAVAVRNAVSEIKKCADYVTAKKGGDGAVREVIEIILKTQKKWQKAVSEDLHR